MAPSQNHAPCLTLFKISKHVYIRPDMRKLFTDYGIYIPLLLVVTFSITGLIQQGTGHWTHIILTNLLIYGVGAQALGFAFGHLFKADIIAEYIGWPKGNPFQQEVGLANLGIGTLGVCCGWFDNGFWLATIIVFTIFMWGCAVGHILEQIKNRNKERGNAGFVFYWDILMPLVLIIFWFIDSKG